MKKYIAILAMIFCFAMTGCSGETVKNISFDTGYNSMFITVESGDYFSVVYQKDTKVMYAVSSHTVYSSGILTLLVDADGNPLLYEEGE